MGIETTNPVTVGSPTKKTHYDKVFENTTWLVSVLQKAMTPFSGSTLLDNKLLQGHVQRPQFSRASTNSITISPGIYALNDGSTNRMCYWDSDLTYTFTNLTTVSTWCYLYLDESKITTNLLTATAFIDSTIPSTYIPAKHGEYNAKDRCILAVRSNTAGEIEEFHHSGELVIIKEIVSYVEGTVATAWTTVSIAIPRFAQRAMLNSHAYKASTGTIAYAFWRPDGSTDNYHSIIGVSSAGELNLNSYDVITSTAQKIEISASTSILMMDIKTDGWYFPAGM